MKQNIIFSVIIVSYKKLDILVECLDSIEKYNDIGKELEVIVVDNSPENNIVIHLKKHYPWVKVISNENKGFGQANNVGTKAAKGEYLLFLNPDTIFIEPVFKFAIAKFNEDCKLASFGVNLVDRNLKKNFSYAFIDFFGFKDIIFNKLFNFLRIYVDQKMFISGANIFIRKDIFNLVGMFDENVFMYYEEPDLYKRIYKHGFKTDFVKGIRLIHLEGQTTKNNDTINSINMQSLKYYCKKYNLKYFKILKSNRGYFKFKLLVLRVFRSNKINELEEYVKFINKLIKIERYPDK